MFAQLLSGKNRSRRRSQRHRSKGRSRFHHSHFGRGARFEQLEDRWMLSAGTLDPTFGTAGFTITQFADGTRVSADALSIQQDGKLVAVGWTRDAANDYDVVIARYDANGSLDGTFGDSGLVVQENARFGRGVAIDQSGRILVAANVGDGFAASAVVLRYDPNGALDTSFGVNGIAVAKPSTHSSTAYNIAIQGDGSIVVVGRADNASIEYADFFVARFLSDGALDSSFGNGGKVVTPFGGDDIAEAVAIDQFGRIVVVGSTRDTSPTNLGSDFAVARYNSDGSLDTAFDGDGFATIAISGDFEVGYDVALDSSGRIIIAGQSSGFPGANDAAIMRLNDDGSLDTTFNGVGYRNGTGQTYRSLALQDDGKIVAGGGGQGLVVSRFNADGSFDTSFNGGSTSSVFTSSADVANDLLIQPDGKVVVLGVNIDQSNGSGSPQNVFLTARYLGDIQPVAVTGRIFDDANNDGLDTGDTGLGGLSVTLTGSDVNGPVNFTTTTLADGSYVFDDVLPGTYSITAEQHAGLLDGKETAGTLGGTVDNTQDSNTISGIVIGTDGADATGYNFAEIRPSDVLGLVWQDFNNDGEVNFGEKAIENVPITLSGTDDRGNPVNLATQTDVDGVYLFYNLRPGNYTLTETQPAGLEDGLDIVGTIDGVPIGDNSANDLISGIVVGLPGSVAQNYNFGERPPAGGAVTAGQTATIGFWQNKNGQALIKSLNGGATSTELSAWLSTTFVNMYGDDGIGPVNANDLTGMTNVQVADFYSDLFRRKKKEALQLGLGGPTKMDAQVMAVALATYVTNQTLADFAATSYGFLVTEHGVGTATFNVGGGGAAFNVALNTNLAVLDLLFATNDSSKDGVLYDLDGDGDADDSWETTLRTLANDVYAAINESGGI